MRLPATCNQVTLFSKLLALLLLMVFILVGFLFGVRYQHAIAIVNRPIVTATFVTKKLNNGIANPASAFCTSHSGKLTIKQNDQGSYGLCAFADGSQCEEWRYFRGECRKGDSLATPSATPVPTVVKAAVKIRR